MSDPHEAFLYDFAVRAQYRLVANERALGATWTEAYLAAWASTDEMCRIARAPDRPLITLGLRSITT